MEVPPGFVLADIQELIPDDNRIVFVEHKQNQFKRFKGYINEKTPDTTSLIVADGGLVYAEGDNVIVENERYNFYTYSIGGKRRSSKKSRRTRRSRVSKKKNSRRS